jgi:hypothetical protein
LPVRPVNGLSEKKDAGAVCQYCGTLGVWAGRNKEASMDAVLSLLGGAFGGGLLVWLFRSWISERLKQSIQHEYAQKLETYKAELNAATQAVLHERQLQHLRTSLFFDHQRIAFANILSQLAEVQKNWFETGHDPENGYVVKPVPLEDHKKFKRVFYDHQLFLDSDCLLATDFILETMEASLPWRDASGDHPRDCQAPFDRLNLLETRLAELFQEKIGIRMPQTALEEIALLGGITLLNRYHFAKIDLPPKGSLKATAYEDTAYDAMIKARDNKKELISKLKDLAEYLKRDGVFYDARHKAEQYLRILNA